MRSAEWLEALSRDENETAVNRLHELLIRGGGTHLLAMVV